jgi:hypothetical protein
MFNPLSEVAESHTVDAELLEQAKNGDRSALAKLVLRHQVVDLQHRRPHGLPAA